MSLKREIGDTVFCSRWIHCVMVAFVLFVMQVSCGEQDVSSDEFEEYMDSASLVWEFKGTYLASKGDSILARGARGMADLTAQRENVPETKFLIGSTTKPFTAIAILQLAERGLIELNSPISDYLPDYSKEAGERVTIHHLLSHRSGIPDVLTNREFFARVGEPMAPAEIVEFFENQPLNFDPGERYEYSSSNYVLLGLIIEQVTGETWADYIDENILKPCGMTNTGVFYDYPNRDDFALGYTSDKSGATVRAPFIHPSCGYAAGALASNVDDLFRLNLALYDGTLLGEEMLDSMLTPHSPTYGYGWMIDEFGGHRLTAHGGSAPGYASIVQRWVDDSVFVVVLCNSNAVRAHTIANGLAGLALGEEVDMPVQKSPIITGREELEEYEGKYVRRSGEYLYIELIGGNLTSRFGDGTPLSILPEAEDRFYFGHDPMTTLTFIRDSAGDITAHVLTQAFEKDTAWHAD